MKIGTRLFLALASVSLLVLLLNAAAARWNFQTSFLQYVEAQQLERARQIVPALAEVYASENGWGKLERSPRRWQNIVSGRAERGERRRQRPPERPERRKPPGGPPPGPPLDLLDADKNVIFGPRVQPAYSNTLPIEVAGDVVGYLALHSQQHLTGVAEKRFSAYRDRSNYWITIAAIIMAALISGLIARQLTRPIRGLAKGVNAIATGDYAHRLDEQRKDELGACARAVNQLSEALQSNKEAREQWVADIAHELRTPLAVLRGEIEAIEDGIRVFDENTGRSLLAEIGRLSKLVSDLNDLSKSDQGGLSYRREKLDVAAHLNDSLVTMSQRLANEDIFLEKEISTEPIWIHADPDRLEQLFVNLLENTLHYTDKPGNLRVRCKSRADAVCIDFDDTEPGVPASALARLFDRLYRVEGSRSRQTGGSGLGLAICKAIVNAHDGLITASASQLGGLSIRVEIPLHNDASQS